MPDIHDFLVPSDNGACGYYRILRPGKAQSILNRTTPLQWPYRPSYADWKKYNIGKILFNRAMSDEDVKYWKGLRRLLPNVPFFLDFDDALWASPPRSTYRPPRQMLRNMDMVADLADILVASTETLRERLEHRYRRPVRLMPNLLFDNEYATSLRHRAPGQKLRVLWSGSDTHGPDLEQIIPVVLTTRDKYDWVFKGYVPPVLRDHVEFHPLTPTYTYLNDIHNLKAHVGIAPLVDNLFNRCKSNLKVLEYSALGVPSVASDVEPYSPASVITAGKGRPRDWIDALALLEDEDYRLESARIAQTWSKLFSFSHPVRAQQLMEVYECP